MSRDDPINPLSVFGYFFDDSAANTSYPPPADRPLLHDAENSFLESFFSNPENLDPLAFMPTEYQGEGNAMYANQNVDWNNTTANEYNNTSTNITATGQPSRSDWQSAGYGLQPDLDEPSADVYAAAGILHNNNSSRLQSDNYHNNAFAVPTSTSAQSGDAMNGYTYPPIGAGADSPYVYEPAQQPNPQGFGAGARFSTTEPAGPFLASLQDRLQDRLVGGVPAPPRPSGPLVFGSDDNFRGSYVAPPGDTPDKTLEDAMAHNFADNSKAHRQRRAPTAAMRKRTRGVVDEQDAIDGALGGAVFDGDDLTSKRRRKDDGEAAESDFGTENTGPARGKKGRKRQTSATVSGSDVKEEGGSPGKKGRPSTSNGTKSSRENLTEEQKRNNHIQSEQKRRNLIKQGFDDLNRMVPELRSGSLSKSNMLVESAKFMRSLVEFNDELRDQLQGMEKG